MQSLKTVVVIATLAIVGYGVHVVLNKPPGSSDDAVWNTMQGIELPPMDVLPGGSSVPTWPPTNLSPGNAAGPAVPATNPVASLPASQPAAIAQAPVGWPTTTSPAPPPAADPSTWAPVPANVAGHQPGHIPPMASNATSADPRLPTRPIPR